MNCRGYFVSLGLCVASFADDEMPLRGLTAQRGGALLTSEVEAVQHMMRGCNHKYRRCGSIGSEVRMPSEAGLPPLAGNIVSDVAICSLDA